VETYRLSVILLPVVVQSDKGSQLSAIFPQDKCVKHAPVSRGPQTYDDDIITIKILNLKLPVTDQVHDIISTREQPPVNAEPISTLPS
jgi:hypothetical protein